MEIGEIGRGWGLDSSGWGQGPVATCCEHGNEPSGTVKGGELHLLSAICCRKCFARISNISTVIVQLRFVSVLGNRAEGQYFMRYTRRIN
jgi:hypothetical protein